jgi:hypothetical protein
MTCDDLLIRARRAAEVASSEADRALLSALAAEVGRLRAEAAELKRDLVIARGRPRPPLPSTFGGG